SNYGIELRNHEAVLIARPSGNNASPYLARRECIGDPVVSTSPATRLFRQLPDGARMKMH
ncbi:MAG: hypothetical protein ACO3F9_11910, partial [Burkholderiales bacterium]